MEENPSWTHSAAFFWVVCILVLKRSGVVGPLEGGDNVMTETSEFFEELVAYYRRQIDVRKSGFGYLFTLPHTLHDGSPVELYVEFDGQTARISDQGRLWDHLDMAGVDLGKQQIATAWQQIQTSVGYAPVFSAEPWELSAFAERSQLRSALYAVADSAVHADGLMLASQYWPRSFSETGCQHSGPALDRGASSRHSMKVPLTVSCYLPGRRQESQLHPGRWRFRSDGKL
jgi:Domain of unknown function DUF1828